MERLGLLRTVEAVPGLVRALAREDLDLKLVAMRALAAIGDPSSLPAILDAAQVMPPGLLPRLASVMLEFGEPGRDAVKELMNRRSADFPQASVPALLKELAQDWGAA
jgi:HEAT repeat protein